MKRKVALITGSTSGIGHGIAVSLARLGHHIIIHGLGDSPHIQDIVRTVQDVADGGTVLYRAANLMHVQDIEEMMAWVRAKLGPIDILVNNAGIQHVAPLEDFPAEKWDAILATNLSATFHTTRLVVAGMKENGWGRIINIASAHALVASPFKSAYVAAKHGVAGLTKVTALETAPYGITCNAICPGYVDTPLVRAQIPQTAEARGLTPEQVIQDVLLAAQPTKQFVTIDQVAGLCTFLCSDTAASITGSLMSIDGGWTAQ